MPSKSKTTSTQEVTLPENQQANVDLLQQGAGQWYGAGGPKFYGGETVAQPGANVTAGQNATLGAAAGIGGLLDTAQRGDAFWLNPDNIFNPSSIPGFDAAQKSVVQNTTRNLTEGILPQIRAGSSQSGMYGGSKQSIGEGLAIGRTNDALAGQLAQMQMGAFDKGLNMYNAAQGRVGQTVANSLLPGQVQTAVGRDQQADAQRNIDASRERFDFEQMAPLFALQQLQALTGQAGTYGGTQKTTNVQKTGFNPMQALGAVTGIAGAAGGLGWTPFKA